MINQAAKAGLLALPGVLTVYFSFNAGGFFPNTPAFVAIALAAILALRVIFAEAPFEGFNRALAIAAGALLLYGVWTLLSAIWSDSLGRSLVELNRILLYLLALVLFGSMARTSECMRWMVRGVALGILVVCVAALITRVLPDVWSIAPNISNNRLSYPLTYWNALGMLASLGMVFCLHLTCSLSEPRWVRVPAAGALPPLAATLLFTFSRGAIGAAIAGLVAYAVLARPRGLVSGLLAAAPTTAIALVVSYNADLLATDNPTAPAAVAQGHDVALAVGFCAAAAMITRALLLVPDRWLARFRLPLRRSQIRPLLAVSAVAGVVVLFALGVPAEIERQYDRFVEGNQLGTSADLRTRLTDPGNNGRIEQWDVVVDAFDQAPIEGQGAGTYELLWAKDRPSQTVVTDAHSLYVEVLGELGVVGLALLAVAILMIALGIAARASGHSRTVYAAILAAALAWALHAGLDWDWEMPAVTLWLFALGGAALATHKRRISAPVSPPVPLRAAVALGCAAVAVIPALVFVSQARLDDSLDAFSRGDCAEAIDAARSSSSTLGARPEPYEIIGYCEARDGSARRSVRAMGQAIDRDPDNWEYRYGLALARGVSGLDPLPAARAALRRNPLDSSTRYAVARFRTDRPSLWRRRARELVELAFR